MDELPEALLEHELDRLDPKLRCVCLIRFHRLIDLSWLKAHVHESRSTSHRQHRSVEFRHFLQTVNRAAPAELELHLVLDNTSTNKSPIIHHWPLGHPRVHLHFTPTSAS